MGVCNKHFDLLRPIMHFIYGFYLDKLLIFFAGEKGSCLGALTSSDQKPPACSVIAFIPRFPLLIEEFHTEARLQTCSLSSQLQRTTKDHHNFKCSLNLEHRRSTGRPIVTTSCSKTFLHFNPKTLNFRSYAVKYWSCWRIRNTCNKCTHYSSPVIKTQHNICVLSADLSVLELMVQP